MSTALVVKMSRAYMPDYRLQALFRSLKAQARRYKEGRFYAVITRMQNIQKLKRLLAMHLHIGMLQKQGTARFCIAFHLASSKVSAQM